MCIYNLKNKNKITIIKLGRVTIVKHSNIRTSALTRKCFGLQIESLVCHLTPASDSITI